MPSKWMLSGDSRLVKFRNSFKNDKRISVFYDYVKNKSVNIIQVSQVPNLLVLIDRFQRND